jgi:tetratricopeptide (TPR) repeat protein
VTAGPETLAEILTASGIDPATFIQPLELSPQMKEWVHDNVRERSPEKDRLYELMGALTQKDGLAVRYLREQTGTAQEVFESGEANCLSFTNLFIALAREVGVDAYFLNVQRVPRYELEGDLVVRWEHVTAGWGGGDDRTVLEFGVVPEEERYATARRISDLTALAMFYSNRGAEALIAGDTKEALRWLEIGVVLDPTWSHGWLNLGVARRRAGDLAGAEIAYRRGIESNPDQLQLYSNLATLLRLRGDHDAASELLRLLDRRDNRNPFIYLSLGDTALREARLDEAGRFYRRALQLSRDNAESKAAMGLWELASDNPAKARVWLERAERIDAAAERVLRLRSQLSVSAEPLGTVRENGADSPSPGL